jgi:ribosomal protein S18 acetylase RimI-like enzyme
MPDITLEEKPPTIDEYRRLRVEAGLSAKSSEAAERGLAGTWYGVTLRDTNRAIGMGRIVGDGGCFFQIVDIAILPAYQRRGLGARVMDALMRRLRARAPESAHVSLMADGDAAKLYAKFGFRETAPASVGMALKL